MIETNLNLIPEPDRDYLLEKGYSFEIIPQGGEVHLILREVPFSERFTPRIADILIVIPVGYPNAPLDMFWTFPVVSFADGSAPAATEHRQNFHDKLWQRWSRHGEWRSGIDSLRTFISTIKNEIESVN